MTDANQPTISEPQHTPPPLALVVDDDPLFRTLLVSMLKREYQIAVAVDGSDGFYKALERPPSIAVIDIQMPVWDGVKTIKAFRENDRLRQIPLLVLTSDTSKETVLAAVSAGADDYVMKSSLSREEFLQKLRELRDRPRPQASSRSPFERSERPAMRRASSTAKERLMQAVIDAWE